MRDTHATKAARIVEPDPYRRRFPARGWNRLITVCDDHGLFNRLPEFNGWTQARHEAVARAYLANVAAQDRAYVGLCALMERVYGNGNGVLISGCYREHFPEPIKNDLRTIAHMASHYLSRALSHWRAAGKTRRTFTKAQGEVAS